MEEGHLIRCRLRQITLLWVVATVCAVWFPAGAQADFLFSPSLTLGAPANAPDLAADPQGRTTIVWQEMDDDGVTRLIQVTRRASDGTLSALRTLASMTSGPACSCPKVVVDPAGRATVAWIAGVDPDDRNRMQAIQLDGDGVPISPVKTLSAADEVASRHDLAVDSQGRATVVWQNGGGLGEPGARIEAARLLPDGTSDVDDILSKPGVESTMPAVAMDGEVPVVVWDSTEGLQLIRWSEGIPSMMETVLPPEANAAIPQIAIDSSGSATIAFWRADGFRSKAVQVERDGNVGPVLDLSVEGEQTLEPFVAIDSLGRVTVVWQSFTNHIKIARIEVDGSVGPVRIISGSEARPVGQPAISMGPEDKAVVVWGHSPPTFIEPEPAPECEVGFDPQADVVQAVFIGADGIPGPIHSVSASGEQSISPAVAADPHGGVTVAWRSFDGTYYCSDVQSRLQMSWGPWSPTKEIIEDIPRDVDPIPPGEPSPPAPARSAMRLSKRAVVRGRFVVVRGVCISTAGTGCKSRLKLVSPKRAVLASGRAQLAAGARKTLRLPLTRSGRALLHKRPRGVLARLEGAGVIEGKVAISSSPIQKRKPRRRF